MRAAQFKANLILTYSSYIPYTAYNLQVRSGSQNCWPLWTFNWTIGPVLPQARTLDRTMVRFSCIQVQTMVLNWTLPSLGRQEWLTKAWHTMCTTTPKLPHGVVPLVSPSQLLCSQLTFMGSFSFARSVGEVCHWQRPDIFPQSQRENHNFWRS